MSWYSYTVEYYTVVKKSKIVLMEMTNNATGHKKMPKNVHDLKFFKNM